MNFTKIRNLIRSYIHIITLSAVSVVVLLVNLRINFFRYNNFDFGKFDLGNMTQMVWNTLHGRVLYMTDYFGTNLPRWSMSHVDPILLLFVPIFALFQHPMTLVVSQLVLVIGSAFLIYKIAELELGSRTAALLLSVAFLFYPAVGFLTAWTGFHGVTVVIPFFLAAFYLYEKMYKMGSITGKGLIIFWSLLVLTIFGKEQLPLYVSLYGIFIWLFRNNKKLGFTMFAVGIIWFVINFFVIIPYYAHYRIEGYERFAQTIGIGSDLTRDVTKPNYFLSRYDAFGDSYSEVIINMIIQPETLVRVFFGGDKMDNLRRTFEPVGYLPFISPAVLVISAPDFLINYLTTAGGIGTAEINNHRISMIVPVIFLSTIFSIGFLGALTDSYFKKYRIKGRHIVIGVSAFILFTNIYTSYTYNNPVYLWFTQAVQKRVAGIAFAKTDTEIIKNEDIKPGDVFKITPLENKDRECALKVIDMIPGDASVSGPDYLGAHLSMRETYAIFPALYKEADYVIVDVFSRKILTILDVNLDLVNDVVGDLIKNPDYQISAGCGNLFVFKNVGPHNKTDLLPLQEKFVYDEKFDYEIFNSLTVVDYEIPEVINRGEPTLTQIVFVKRDDDSLDDYFSFLSFIHKETGEVYQVATLPSFGLIQLGQWVEDHYYIETNELALPSYLDTGQYQVFTGISNVIRTRSIYLGEVEVR